MQVRAEYETSCKPKKDLTMGNLAKHCNAEQRVKLQLSSHAPHSVQHCNALPGFPGSSQTLIGLRM